MMAMGELIVYRNELSSLNIFENSKLGTVLRPKGDLQLD
jgi:hypothetical protein